MRISEIDLVATSILVYSSSQRLNRSRWKSRRAAAVMKRRVRITLFFNVSLRVFSLGLVLTINGGI